MSTFRPLEIVKTMMNPRGGQNSATAPTKEKDVLASDTDDSNNDSDTDDGEYNEENTGTKTNPLRLLLKNQQ